MAAPSDPIRTYFKKLGFESEIADIYLALHTHGPQTISALARNARVERTKIYRLIDTLMESNLIEVESQYKRGIMRAAPISNIRILIAQREHDLRSLQDDLELIEESLARNSLSDPTTRVQFYRGPEGYKQMLWNETRATTEVLAITRNIMQPHTGRQFYERYAEACNNNHVRFRDLYSDEFLQSEHDWWQKHPEAPRLTFYESRYLPPSEMPITISQDMYDDVVAYFSWRDDDIFGIEIYNRAIADAQRNFFDRLWVNAQDHPPSGATPSP